MRHFFIISSCSPDEGCDSGEISIYPWRINIDFETNNSAPVCLTRFQPHDFTENKMTTYNFILTAVDKRMWNAFTDDENCKYRNVSSTELRF